MVSIHSFAASGSDTNAVLGYIGHQIAKSGAEAHFIFAFYGYEHDGAKILASLNNRFPQAAIVGGTSCRGFMTDAQLWGKSSIGLLLIDDAEGQYGVSAVSFTDDPAADAQAALNDALKHAACPGELPSLIWIYQAPGHEEETIDGLRRVVGDRCPIVGGSSADDDQSGHWQQIGPEGVFQNGIAVAVLFPSGGIGTAFQGGFEPAGPSGIVTRIGFDDGGQNGIVTKGRGREIVEIDGRPAAQVYDEWVGNILGEKILLGGNVLKETTMHPLAVEAGDIKGVPHYLLIHPKTVAPDGTMSTFAAVEEGARIHCMRGNRKRLAGRAAHVAAEAVAQLPGGTDSLAGGLVVYCAGCQMAVGDKMSDVAREVTDNFTQHPFLGCFTFGEQGCISDRNVHGNLMISAVAFGT